MNAHPAGTQFMTADDDGVAKGDVLLEVKNVSL